MTRTDHSRPAAQILGLGTARPQVSYPQAEAAAMARARCTFNEDQADWLEKRYLRSQVRERGIVFNRANGHAQPDSDQPVIDDFFPPANAIDDRGPSTAVRMEHFATVAPPLAEEACRIAIEEARLATSQITHLVTVSCTGLAAPGVDVTLMHRLALRPDVARTNIGFMGCHGAFNGLRVAKAFAQSDPKAKVLLVCVEICSLHFHYGYDPGKIVANALFADGAAAAVISADPGLPDAASAWSLEAETSCVLADSTAAMGWTVGDHGFEMTLGSEVPELIKLYLPDLLNRWLHEHHYDLSQIRGWAIHPGGPKILSTITAALGLPYEAAATARRILGDYGNMSSATVLFVIDALRKAEGVDHRPCVAMSFGPGLTAELALLT